MTWPQYGEWWRWTVAKTSDGFITPSTKPFVWRKKPDELKVRDWFMSKIEAGELENCDGGLIDGFYCEPGAGEKRRIPVPSAGVDRLM
jgi:hypothetical protein